QVEGIAFDGPLEIMSPATKGLLDAMGELVERRKLPVVEHTRVDACGVDRALVDAAVCARDEHEILLARPACEDTSRAVDAVTIGHHDPGDDGFAEPPRRFDHALVRAGQWVAGEQYARDVRAYELLDDHGDARRPVDAEARAISAHAWRARGLPNL